MYGLSDSLIEQIKAITERHKVLKLVLFGSRARGNFRANSDIDLAAYGLLPRNEMTFLKEIEESGIVLLGHQKVYAEQFPLALRKLQDAVEEAQASPSTVIRDGVFHRFEIASEPAESLSEKLLKDSYINIDSPKATMRQACVAGLVDDEAAWLSLLQV